MRLTAPNPSPMTSTGTNTYILGRKELLIIDPGPNSEAHLRNIMEVIPNNSSVFLEVNKSNFIARKIYSNLNFKNVDIRKSYYNDGGDALIMKHKK